MKVSALISTSFTNLPANKIILAPLLNATLNDWPTSRFFFSRVIEISVISFHVGSLRSQRILSDYTQPA